MVYCSFGMRINYALWLTSIPERFRWRTKSEESSGAQHPSAAQAALTVTIRTNGDPFEYGRARPLDFGHWSAHKLELMSGFAISHGQAVATGVLLDSIYAEKKGWLTKAEMSAIGDGFRRSGFHLWFDELNQRDAEGLRIIFGGLKDFQEHLGGELTVTFPRGLGARHEVHEIDLALMELALQELEAFARSR